MTVLERRVCRLRVDCASERLLSATSQHVRCWPMADVASQCPRSVASKALDLGGSEMLATAAHQVCDPARRCTFAHFRPLASAATRVESRRAFIDRLLLSHMG